MDQPPQSPDLNIAEEEWTIWTENQPATKEELWNFFQTG